MCVRGFKEVLDEQENEVRRKVSQEKMKEEMSVSSWPSLYTSQEGYVTVRR
jgi:hypothetical protein